MHGQGRDESLAIQRARYQPACRKTKRLILDETVGVLGVHRKSAIRTLRRKVDKSKKRGRRATYPRSMLTRVLRYPKESRNIHYLKTGTKITYIKPV